MTIRTDIAIIGPGRVGTALGILAERSGYHVTAVGARREEAAHRAATAIGDSVRVTDPRDASASASIVFLAVPDDAIASVALDLAEARAMGEDAVAVHLSGALTSSVLQPLQERCGCRVASAHPLQTFPTVAAAVEKLPGTSWFCEGDAAALPVIRSFVNAIGSNFVEIQPSAKVLYHASAVFACNYLAALIDSSLACAESANIDRSDMLAALTPLIDATIANIRQLGTAKALTGPIARGDCSTVRSHIAALDAAAPELSALYKALAIRTVELAVTKGTLRPDRAAELRRLLEPRTDGGRG